MKISENFSAKGDEPGKTDGRAIADSKFQIPKMGNRERTKEGISGNSILLEITRGGST